MTAGKLARHRLLRRVELVVQQPLPSACGMCLVAAVPLSDMQGAMQHSFGSTCHGALSRTAAMRQLDSKQVWSCGAAGVGTIWTVFVRTLIAAVAA